MKVNENGGRAGSAKEMQDRRWEGVIGSQRAVGSSRWAGSGDGKIKQLA